MTAVGIIGAGPGVSALHQPTLARLPRFRVVHVVDGGSGRAGRVAERVGARTSPDVAGLLADPEVEVVLVAGPPDRHAEHVIAAAEAGVRGILCEKPLATRADDAEAAITACRAAGVALVVGTNHLFDPAWARAQHHLTASGGRVQSLTILASLAPNDRYHRLVTEYAPAGSPPPRDPPDRDDPEVVAAVLRQLVIGLAVHDLPIVRDLTTGPIEVAHARFVPPIGYELGLRVGDAIVRLVAAMRPPAPGSAGPDTLWRMTIATAADRLEVDFPPPFVHAGPATVRVRGVGGAVTRYPRGEGDGYLAEWNALAQLLDSGAPVEYDALLADALFAIDLADAVAARARSAA
ncbi:MAG: Gfo/Idh/MocA family oxidoreductase [Actinomycetales bacterium]|nr:Gfo/Idh/MocA family oxidoreductase [Actinomycetales bacterium]